MTVLSRTPGIRKLHKSVNSSTAVRKCGTLFLGMDPLIGEAIAARKSAYAAYSNFPVGAALECEDGKLFRGCNVENISFGLTICAERVAVSTAIAAGNTKFRRLAIVADTDEPISPCGACRQVLAEFNPQLKIISANLRGTSKEFSLAELLPRPATGILNQP